MKLWLIKDSGKHTLGENGISRIAGYQVKYSEYYIMQILATELNILRNVLKAPSNIKGLAAKNEAIRFAEFVTNHQVLDDFLVNE